MIFSQSGFCLFSKANVAVVALFFIILSFVVVQPDSLFGREPVGTERYNFSREDETFLDQVQKQAFRFFTDCVNPENGLVMDKAINSKSAGVLQVNFP